MQNVLDVRVFLCVILVELWTVSAWGVTTNVIDVAEGETTTLSEELADITPVDGDWIVKTGKGTLQAVSDYKTIKLNFHIKEGVYLVPNSAGTQVHKGNTAILIIDDGATLNIPAGSANKQFFGGWAVTFAGHGTGQGENLGAICIGGGQTNPTLSEGGSFTMTGDATIYSYGTMNAVFSGTGSSSGPTLNMQTHTLTIRGKASTSVFRPRWRWGIKNPGTIILQNGQFARHDTTNDFASEIPLIKVIEGGKLAAYGNGKIWSKVAAFDFAAGTSLAKGYDSPTTATLTMGKVIGPVGVSDTLLTISKCFVVRGTDLMAGNHLTAAQALTFAEGCTLEITDWGTLSFVPGARYVVAECTAGILGTPTLVGTTADLFTLEMTETQLTLVAKDSNQVPNLLVGEENAAHNSQVMAAVTLVDGHALCLPGGEYHFESPIDFSAATAKDVTISCLTEAPCTLRTGLKLGAMENLLIRNLRFKELTTPAVVAAGTDGLTIRDCALESVAGTCGEAGNFPYVLENVTDFKLLNPTYVADAEGGKSTLWDASAFFNGGSQAIDSVARAGEIVIYNAQGAYVNNWWQWADATNRLHLTTSAYANKTLRKTGPATLDVSVDLGNVGITNLEVSGGQYVARSNGALGTAGKPVYVHAGAALTLAGGGESVKDRTVTISGTGLSATVPAIRFTEKNAWNKVSSVTWVLEDDATMYNNCSGENGTFLWGAIKMNGHALTLTGIAEANYRFGRTFKWHGGGRMIVDGVKLSSSSGDSATTFKVDTGDIPLFVFVDGASLVPDNADIFNLIKNVDFTAETKLDPKNMTPCTFAQVTGPMDASSKKVNGVTITGSLKARAADLTVSKAMTVNGTLAFGTGVTMEVDDPAALANGRYTLATATAISGRPKTTGATAAAGLVVYCQGTSLMLGPPNGVIILVR